MSYQGAFCHWQQEVSSHLAHLSRPQAYVLACWSFAMAFVHSSGISRAACWLSLLMGSSASNWRQCLREYANGVLTQMPLSSTVTTITLEEL